MNANFAFENTYYFSGDLGAASGYDGIDSFNEIPTTNVMPGLSDDFIDFQDTLAIPKTIIETFGDIAGFEESLTHREEPPSPDTVTIDLSDCSTIGDVINKINATNAGYAASIENGKFTIRREGSTEEFTVEYVGKGDFGRVTGLGNYTEPTV